jgi:hypothetical protein
MQQIGRRIALGPEQVDEDADGCVSIQIQLDGIGLPATGLEPIANGHGGIPREVPRFLVGEIDGRGPAEGLTSGGLPATTEGGFEEPRLLQRGLVGLMEGRVMEVVVEYGRIVAADQGHDRTEGRKTCCAIHTFDTDPVS